MVAFRTVALPLLVAAPALAAVPGRRIVARQAGFNFGALFGDELEALNNETATAPCFNGPQCGPLLAAITANQACVSALTLSSTAPESLNLTQVDEQCFCTDPVVAGLPACIKCFLDGSVLTAQQVNEFSEEFVDDCAEVGKVVTGFNGATPNTTTTTGTTTRSTTTATGTRTTTGTTTTPRPASGTNTNTNTNTATNPAATGSTGFKYTMSSMAAAGSAALLFAALL